MIANQLTISEKTLIIELIAREIQRLENEKCLKDKINDFERIIEKLERM